MRGVVGGASVDMTIYFVRIGPDNRFRLKD
jgi:hypothetical protein